MHPGSVDDDAITSVKAYDSIIDNEVNIIQTDHPKLLPDHLKTLYKHN
ncbi:hypothetical protein [Reichenbachiella sp. MALMAid0571]